MTLPIHPDIDIVPELKEFGKVRAPSAKPTEPERAPARLIEGVISAASNIPVIGIAAGDIRTAWTRRGRTSHVDGSTSRGERDTSSAGLAGDDDGDTCWRTALRGRKEDIQSVLRSASRGTSDRTADHNNNPWDRWARTISHIRTVHGKNPIDINPIIDALSSEDTWPEAARLITDAFQEEGHETGIIRGANGEIIVHLKETLPAIETANALEKQTGIKTNCGTGSTNCAGHETKDEIELLIGKMGSGDPEEVKIVSDQLTRLGAVAVPSLILGAKNPNILIRESSLVVLGNIGGNPAISTLLDAINDKDDKVRLTAALALMKIDPSVIEGMGGNFLKVTLTLIDILARTPEENKQKILTRVTSLGEPVVPYFIVALSARNPDYAFEAYHSLIAIGKPAVSPLKSLFLNKNSGIRDTAVLALGEIGAQSGSRRKPEIRPALHYKTCIRNQSVSGRQP